MTSAGFRLAERGLRAPVDDHALGDAGRLVDLLRHRGALDRGPRSRSTPSTSVRIGRVKGSHSAMRWPRLILSPSSTFSRAPYCTRCTARSAPSRSTMTTATLRAITIRSPFGVAREVAVADLHRAVEVRLDERLIGELRRAADVEGAHRELRARLADRLRRDDADRLAHVDRRAAREIAPVAGAADAVLGLAGQHRADLHLLDAGGVDRRRYAFLDDHLAGRHDRSCRRDPSDPRPRCGRGCARRARRRPCPASTIARILMPPVEPQSGMVMIESCATSTRRRVR